jgi:hypothetical protein
MVGNAVKKITRETVMNIQIEEIKKHKWIASEKAGRDLGDLAIHEWIDQYAAAFREYWESRLEGS